MMQLKTKILTPLKSNFALLSFMMAVLFSGCIPQPIYHSVKDSAITQNEGPFNHVIESFTGTASFYADKFHGKKTANGETFNMHDLTAAHKSLPFGTIVKVTNLSNNKSVKLRINDRGPFVKDRIIDVSLAAAKQLDMLGTGTAEVRIDVLGVKK